MMRLFSWAVHGTIISILAIGLWNAATKDHGPRMPVLSATLWERKKTDRPVIVMASWYAKGLKDPEAMMVASNRWNRGTKLALRVRSNDPWTLVKVQDFGPDPTIHPERSLDVSLGVARRLGMVSRGVAFVEVWELK